MEYQWSEIREKCVVYEDEELLLLDKPVGISVVGERHGADLLQIAAEAGEKLHPAHRIDKVTSGLIVLAKTNAAHATLTRQFAKRQVEKQYVAVLNSVGLPKEKVLIDLPLMTAANARIRIAADRSAISFDSENLVFAIPADRIRNTSTVYPSQTFVKVLSESSGRSLVSLWPVSGRRHQLRVHLAWVGHSILGDPLFASTSAAKTQSRTMLHAFRLRIALPWVRDEPMTFETPPDQTFCDSFSPEQQEISELLVATSV